MERADEVVFVDELPGSIEGAAVSSQMPPTPPPLPPSPVGAIPPTIRYSPGQIDELAPGEDITATSNDLMNCRWRRLKPLLNTSPYTLRKIYRSYFRTHSRRSSRPNPRPPPPLCPPRPPPFLSFPSCPPSPAAPLPGSRAWCLTGLASHSSSRRRAWCLAGLLAFPFCSFLRSPPLRCAPFPMFLAPLLCRPWHQLLLTLVYATPGVIHKSFQSSR